MKLMIVTTTINSPTKATLRFLEIAKKRDFYFIIVGDTKTPHSEYQLLEKKYIDNMLYMTPAMQEEFYPELSEIIGWKTIQRRNIGFVHAYRLGADVIATVDDDNVPYDNWGDNVLIGKTIEVDIYAHNKFNVFDPLSCTNHSEIWHRGYPIEYVKEKNDIEYKGKQKKEILIQADLWDGDPDIDAMCRLTQKPIVKFNVGVGYSTNQYSPFNSQNTFLHRCVMKNYFVLPYVGRMDDIWASYITQYYHPGSVIYTPASVYQERNPQDLIKNLENEIIGYRDTRKLIDCIENYTTILPEKTQEFIKIYRKEISKWDKQ